ncbi:2,3-bisphosphoglycerate-independent phosphoglycerate mutase [Eubacterium limosum]|uniref:2,3-bisphosphoglycerate-independent phosphoglycerate mutase n=1 Tax=Eubacterium limosum TaxID=1736 RepID=A0ABT5URA7_EUBLI|nr:2,3-bisphosphoglycerate-independent phosphoglycerate mutase [Eubacterium limosum]MCB6570274.1 2,3-bisphosphoglycerate-independent phosphoglycerate mutase [Eubacterium limosum]MDE1471464.1 2,3-bisphosphoglycerate-independent phosphoglycerate mutase [Eubacterium limosum]
MRGNLTALIILDGYGYTPIAEGNAVLEAPSPNLDAFYEKYPHTHIVASGLGVGLPEGQMGNSEVGHLNLGAGRVVYQELTRITKSIEDGDFFENPVFMDGIKNVKENGTALHVMGLASDGGVHSHLKHLYGLLELAKKEGVEKVYVHCFMDGRDTAPTSGLGFIRELEAKMAEIGVGEIATVEGRYYAMDRDNRWERVEKAYDAIALGKGNAADSAVEAMELSYKEDVNDEFVIPTVIKPEVDKRIQANDTIIFFNFRPDRARELSRTFIEPDFAEFNRERGYIPVHYISMTQYDASFEGVEIAFKPETVSNTLGEYLSNNGVPQLRIAETEKYAHVTYFFNGGLEKQYEGEDRILVPSPKVATYDLQPEMSAYEVTEKVLEAIDSDKYKVIILNYANTDMVGHTGVMEAAEKAVMTVDECSKKVIDAILAKGGNVILTADHGNAEKMIDYDTKKPWTAHTTNPVECVIAGAGEIELRDDGRLADISPTILDLLDMDVPAEMTGTSLIKK